MELAQENRYQFERWTLGLVGARPAEKKQGPDQGIDGRRSFTMSRLERPRPSRFLRSSRGRLARPWCGTYAGDRTRGSRDRGPADASSTDAGHDSAEAASAGFYSSAWGQHPRLQILTIDEAFLRGARVNYPAPSATNVTLRRPPVVTPRVRHCPCPSGRRSPPCPKAGRGSCPPEANARRASSRQLRAKRRSLRRGGGRAGGNDCRILAASSVSFGRADTGCVDLERDAGQGGSGGAGGERPASHAPAHCNFRIATRILLFCLAHRRERFSRPG